MLYNLKRLLLIGMTVMLAGCGSLDSDDEEPVFASHLTGGAIQGSPVDLNEEMTVLIDGFSQPFGITTDGTYLYITDVVAKSLKTITIEADGTSILIDLIDIKAVLCSPSGITTDGAYLYFSDTSCPKIIQYDLQTGTVAVVMQTHLRYPHGITTDGKYVYVADTGNHVVRKIVIKTHEASILAGLEGEFGDADGIDDARFQTPYGITTDGTNLYVADTGNHIIRKIVIDTGEVSTLAGAKGSPGDDDGHDTARFNSPYGVTTDGTNLYVADTGNQLVRKIVIDTGEVTTIADVSEIAAEGNEPESEQNNGPFSITTDGNSVYCTINDKIIKIN